MQEIDEKITVFLQEDKALGLHSLVDTSRYRVDEKELIVMTLLLFLVEGEDSEGPEGADDAQEQDE